MPFVKVGQICHLSYWFTHFSVILMALYNVYCRIVAIIFWYLSGDDVETCKIELNLCTIGYGSHSLVIIFGSFWDNRICYREVTFCCLWLRKMLLSPCSIYSHDCESWDNTIVMNLYFEESNSRFVITDLFLLRLLSLRHKL